MTRPHELLPSCAVRVDVGGTPTGTGFFVAPATVVTCSHVIEAHRLVDGDPAISVVDREGVRRLADVATDAPAEQVDLAILKVRDAGSHLCVLLDPDVQPFDDLYTYGYPPKYPDGVSTTLAAEGPMGNRWTKLKDGQVQFGMSGSPLLNMRTGGVCGILKRSRDPATSSGGYAVSIDAVLQLDTKLSNANESFHARRRDWFKLLDPARQQLLRKSWGSRTAGREPVTYFVLTVGPDGGGSNWHVQAEIEPGGELIGPVQVDLNVVRLEVARLFRDWASRGRVSPEAEQVRLLGSILYGAVFPVAIAERFEQVTAEPGRGRVVVALCFDGQTEPDLMHLPWEHLYRPRRFPDTGMQIAIERSVAFVRTWRAKPVDHDDDSGGNLSVLVVAIEPKRNETVRAVVGQLERTAGSVGNLTLDVIDTPTPIELEDRLLQGYDVLHYVGLGRFRDGVDEIALGGETGDIEYLSIDAVADSLRPPELQLVVLEPCATDTEAVPADFAVLAPTLLEKVPAVLAYQFPLTPETADSFNGRLYRALAQGVPVDAAVQEARNKLRLHGRAFVSPALWVQRPGRLCLALPPGEVVPQELVASHG